MRLRFVNATALCWLLSACAVVSPELRLEQAQALAAKQHWLSLQLSTQPFDLQAWVPPVVQRSEQLTIYIEGDGLAWVSSSRPSDDPTPRNPLALALALKHPVNLKGPAVYLARPCQYVGGEHARGCEQSYWTERRFASPVIESTNQAVDMLMQRYGAAKLTLVGYSGGGAVAALVAARRKDVQRLVTVAGNLDHAYWTSVHHLTPLKGSLNPADAAPALQNMSQLHLVGGADGNITGDVVKSYQSRFAQPRPVVRVMDGFDHSCCWVEQWSVLALQVL